MPLGTKLHLYTISHFQALDIVILCQISLTPYLVFQARLQTDSLILGDSGDVMMDIDKTVISFCQPKTPAMRQRLGRPLINRVMTSRLTSRQKVFVGQSLVLYKDNLHSLQQSFEGDRGMWASLCTLRPFYHWGNTRRIKRFRSEQRCSWKSESYRLQVNKVNNISKQF